MVSPNYGQNRRGHSPLPGMQGLARAGDEPKPLELGPIPRQDGGPTLDDHPRPANGQGSPQTKHPETKMADRQAGGLVRTPS